MNRPGWSWLRRFALQFAVVYSLLYAFPFPLNQIPFQLVSDKAETFWVQRVLVPYSNGMDWLVKFAGRKFFHLEITIGPAGSGDTTWNYVQLAGFVAVALTVALLWSLVDLYGRRDDRHFDRLHDWLRTYLRFYLATNMLGYGGNKVIKAQFLTPRIDQLVQPFGEMSPMGLLWNFMGFSDAYCIFAGAAEMLGGFLLVARRTTTFGALVTIGVMVNIVMLNFCFDTPVKLFSSNLLAMACFLTLPDARRLFDFLVLHRTAQPAPLGALFRSRWLNYAAIVLRTAFLGYAAWSILSRSLEQRHTYGDLSEKPPLYGTWDVDVFERDGEIVSDEAPAPDRWQRLRIGSYRMAIERGDGSTQVVFAQPNKKGNRLDLVMPNRDRRIEFKSELTAPGSLTLEGTLDGRKLHVELTRNAAADYLLLTRGFHWINETPFNR